MSPGISIVCLEFAPFLPPFVPSSPFTRCPSRARRRLQARRGAGRRRRLDGAHHWRRWRRDRRRRRPLFRLPRPRARGTRRAQNARLHAPQRPLAVAATLVALPTPHLRRAHATHESPSPAHHLFGAQRGQQPPPGLELSPPLPPFPRCPPVLTRPLLGSQAPPSAARSRPTAPARWRASLASLPPPSPPSSTSPSPTTAAHPRSAPLSKKHAPPVRSAVSAPYSCYHSPHATSTSFPHHPRLTRPGLPHCRRRECRRAAAVSRRSGRRRSPRRGPERP